MTKAKIAGGAAATVLVVLLFAAGWGALRRNGDSAAPSPAVTSSTAAVHPSFIYGRVTAIAGATYEGRLRFGGDEEAFWGDFLNGVRDKNLWVTHVPPERLPRVRGGIEILGIPIGRQERQADLDRPFMARFGDIARIEARGATGVRVTLKSGSVADLDRMDASDFDDGVRVWNEAGAVSLDSRLIRAIELLPPPQPGPAPDRLHGTVRTRQGDFTGFLQWNREKSLGSDTLAAGEVSLRFDTIGSIARDSSGSARVTMRDGREIALSGYGEGNRGIYVDDARYGRVQVSWEAFERADFSAAGSSGPAYGDFPPGGPLMGSVTTRDGQRLAGRLVYDLDESETTETLDAPSAGVNYMIPFGLIASVAPAGDGESDATRATVTLHSGEELQLERSGDLGDGNGGLLIFTDGRDRAEYVSWTEVERIDFDRPPAMYPPIDDA